MKASGNATTGIEAQTLVSRDAHHVVARCTWDQPKSAGISGLLL